MEHQQHQPQTPNSIIQTRQELIHINSKPSLKLSHFIKPSTPSIISTKSSPFKQIQNVNLNQLQPIHFAGWQNPKVNYKNWVVLMSLKYANLWKKAGIYDAVINSTYKINKLHDLVVGFVMNWCHESKSFVFEWGECSVTLEDMYVLGGYSILGDSVLSPFVYENDSKLAMDSLMCARSEIYKNGAKKVDQNNWMKMFMNVDHPYEHEGFITYWLSMFVFPRSYGSIGKHVVSIAVNLARGRRIALAPAVLASIYRDLSFIVARAKEDVSCGGMKSVTVCAPFQLVQVWIWERFVRLRPNLYILKPVKPRMARWVIDDKSEVIDNVKVSSCLDWNSLGEEFQWRPYASKMNNNIVFSNFYGNKTDFDVSDDELQSFARCLRTCELVGIDCIEQYLPHRVAMQFGFDQEIPIDVITSSDITQQMAWENYSKPIDVTDLLIPSSDATAGVTAAYVEWRKDLSRNESQSVTKGEGSTVTVSQSSKAKKKLKRRKVSDGEATGEALRHFTNPKKKLRNVDSENVPDAPPGFEHISTKTEKLEEISECRLNKVTGRHRKLNDDDLRLPLNDLQDGSDEDKDHILFGDVLVSKKIIPNNSKTSSMTAGTGISYLQDSSSVLKNDNPLSELLKEKEKCHGERRTPVLEKCISTHTRDFNKSDDEEGLNVLETKMAERDEGNDMYASAGDNVLNIISTSYNDDGEGLSEVSAAEIGSRDEKEKPWIRVEKAIEVLEGKLKLLKAAALAKGR